MTDTVSTTRREMLAQFTEAIRLPDPDVAGLTRFTYVIRFDDHIERYYYDAVVGEQAGGARDIGAQLRRQAASRTTLVALDSTGTAVGFIDRDTDETIVTLRPVDPAIG